LPFSVVVTTLYTLKHVSKTSLIGFHFLDSFAHTTEISIRNLLTLSTCLCCCKWASTLSSSYFFSAFSTSNCLSSLLLRSSPPMLPISVHVLPFLTSPLQPLPSSAAPLHCLALFDSCLFFLFI